MELSQFKFMEDKNGDNLILPDGHLPASSWTHWPWRWLRSMHTDCNGRIVSLGFPKFLNLGEGKEGSEIRVDLTDLSKADDLVATLKIDGSLLIRFVRDGKVYFRTRGAFNVLTGVLKDAWLEDEQIFQEKYPALFDPNQHPEQSLLFEYGTPRNTIVIRHQEPSLVFIGAVSYDRDQHWEDARPRLATVAELTNIASVMGLSLVTHFSLKKADELQSLLDQIKDDRKEEGFVLRFDNDQRMAKVKSEWYLKLHALKSNLDTNSITDFWLLTGRLPFKKFQEVFEAQYDWETFQYSLPVISVVFDSVAASHNQIKHVAQFVEQNRTLPRKQFALLSQSRFNDLNLTMCFLMLDNEDVPDKIWKKLVLQKSKYVSRKMFED